MKKGQLFGQPFIYLFMIIVIAIIIIFGFSTIRDFIGFGEKVDVTIFVNNIKSKVNEVYNLDSGSSLSLDELNVPSSINYVCFLNPDERFDFNNEIIKKEIEKFYSNGDNDNLFFIPNKNKVLSERKIFIPNLKSETNPLCKRNLNSRINLILINQGNYVEVKEP